MRTWADLSECRRYRYTLGREWDPKLPRVAFCGLNPSTADETEDDPTIRREIDYAKRWGYGSLVKVNAYAWRSTDPKGLWALGVEPTGGDRNDAAIITAATHTDKFVAAWGTNIDLRREIAVIDLIRRYRVPVYAIGATKHGRPVHPLYQPKTKTPFVWRSP